MIVLYAFTAFLFYKIMPVFFEFPDNTVLGSLIMAICSAIFLVGANMFSLAQAPSWASRIEATEGPVEPPHFAYLAYAACALATCFAGFLIAAGFAPRLYREVWGPMGWHDDSFWFAVMLAIPPLCYSFVPLSAIRAIGKLAQADRKMTSSLKK